MGLTIEKVEQFEDVYDFQVGTTSCFFANDILVHNSEIILRDKQFCNLSEVIIRSYDTKETIKEKCRVATIIGTFQATLTNFKFLSEVWAKNTREEALLGVSMTGIMDNPFMAGQENLDELKSFLDELREYCVEVNKEWAEKLGIKPAGAITCVKPSGCTSLETKVKTVDGSGIKMSEIFGRAGYTAEMLSDCAPGTWLKIPGDAVLPHVLDENNEPQEITNLFVNGVEQVFAITFEDGETYRFTGNHKLKTVNGWKRVDELTEKDDVLSF